MGKTIKEILCLMLVTVMCLTLAACGPKVKEIYVEDVLPLYETIEVTEENLMEYCELAEVEKADIFDESTGEKVKVLRLKEGYFADPKTDGAVRVTYTVTTVKYEEGSERPEFSMENIEDNEFVVNHSTKERDFHLYMGFIAEELETSCLVENGFIYETQITDFSVIKVKGTLVTYNRSEIDNLFSVDDSGERRLEVRKDENNLFRFNETDVGEGDDIYKMIYRGLTGLN